MSRFKIQCLDFVLSPHGSHIFSKFLLLVYTMRLKTVLTLIELLGIKRIIFAKCSLRHTMTGT